MKKVLVIIISLVLGTVGLSAQDLAQATEAYNNAATALAEGNKTGALDFFNQALSLAEALGDEGAEIMERCKSTIPSLMLSIAKDLIKSDDVDAAISLINETVAKAKSFEDDEEVGKATELLGTAFYTKGNSLLNAKDYAGAAEAYKETLKIDGTNGAAAIRLGQALDRTGDMDGAIEAFNLARANGQEANAVKLLGTTIVKQASSLLSAKKYAEALEASKKALEYGDNANAFKIAGTAATQLKNYKEAVSFFESYLKAAPNASDAAKIAETIAVLKKQQ